VVSYDKSISPDNTCIGVTIQLPPRMSHDVTDQ